MWHPLRRARRVLVARLDPILLTIAIVGILVSPAWADICVAPPSEMVSWWTLDETTGTIARDRVGPNDATFQGQPAFIAGKVAGAFGFHSITDFLQVSDGPSLNFGMGDFSIDAWIRTSDTSGGDRTILEKRGGTPDFPQGYALFLNSGLLTFELEDGTGFSGNFQASAPVLTDGQWYHVAVTVSRLGSPSTVKLYVNGASQTLGLSPPVKLGSVSNTSSLLIGQRGIAFGQTDAFSGDIDEIEILSRALSDDEIDQIFRAGDAGKCRCLPPPPNMISWWTGDDCGVSDAIGPNNGTFVGLPDCPTAVKVGAGAIDLSNAYITVPENVSLDFGTGDFSVDAWIETSIGSGSIMEKGLGPTPGWWFGISADRLSFTACDALVCTAPLTSGATVAVGVWRHVALTVQRSGAMDGSGRRSTTVTLYVDGQSDGSASFSLQSLDSPEDLLIGSGLGGTVDELEIFNRALSLAEITSVYKSDSSGKCKCTSPPVGMAAWWPLDEESGTTAYDLVGGHHGTYVFQPAPNAGVVGKALRFHSTPPGDLVRVPNAPGLNFGTGDFSLDAWIYWDPGTLPGEGRAFLQKVGAYRAMASPAGFHLHLGSDEEPFFGHGPLPDPVPFRKWTHVAATVHYLESPPRIEVKYYIDGAFRSHSLPTISNLLCGGSFGDGDCDLSSDGDLFIGGEGNGGLPFEGKVDEVELFNRVLSDSEIAAIYDAGIAGKCKPGLVVGTVFNDHNSNGLRDSDDMGLAGWGIGLMDPIGQIDRPTTTDAAGGFSFGGLIGGVRYGIFEPDQPHWSRTYPANSFQSIIVDHGQVITGLNFGNHHDLDRLVLDPWWKRIFRTYW